MPLLQTQNPVDSTFATRAAFEPGKQMIWLYEAASGYIVSQAVYVEGATYDPQTGLPLRVHVAVDIAVMQPCFDDLEEEDHFEKEYELLEAWVDPAELHPACTQCEVHFATPDDSNGTLCIHCWHEAQGTAIPTRATQEQQITLTGAEYNQLLVTLEAMTDYLQRYGQGHGIEFLLNNSISTTRHFKSRIDPAQTDNSSVVSFCSPASRHSV